MHIRLILPTVTAFHEEENDLIQNNTIKSFKKMSELIVEDTFKYSFLHIQRKDNAIYSRNHFSLLDLMNPKHFYTCQALPLSLIWAINPYYLVTVETLSTTASFQN